MISEASMGLDTSFASWSNPIVENTLGSADCEDEKKIHPHEVTEHCAAPHKRT
jgi:hypothetical protein